MAKAKTPSHTTANTASFFPNVRLAIDIGGQDAKGLKIREGKLLDFVMSDKCAAGTGRFLEVIAAALAGVGTVESADKIIIDLVNTDLAVLPVNIVNGGHAFLQQEAVYHPCALAFV